MDSANSALSAIENSLSDLVTKIRFLLNRCSRLQEHANVLMSEEPESLPYDRCSRVLTDVTDFLELLGKCQSRIADLLAKWQTLREEVQIYDRQSLMKKFICYEVDIVDMCIRLRAVENDLHKYRTRVATRRLELIAELQKSLQ
ncbi:hypothetical protein CDAR_433621 [Caerostris darwini]|uniref:Uncharacterized protein n=1 Tax=Caerostris darwini TaxID=1538125 RepID=A0AAV4PGG0_9ARAC|nr:hypothetical protein CDAR_433621 [Caerostris darwini]